MGIRAPVNDDPQAERVYSMEHAAFEGHYFSKVKLAKLRSVAKAVCREYDVPKIRIHVRHHNIEAGCYWYGYTSIFLESSAGMNMMILLHELAHHIVANKHPKAQAHGPIWVRIYANLLDAKGLVPLAGMRAVCRKYKVKIGR